MSGEYIINVLEPKTWDENGSPEDMDAPMAFQCSSKLSQHISFLKDFFRTYKNFTDSQIDISILENVGRMGVELPSFLKRILVELKKDVENKDL